MWSFSVVYNKVSYAWENKCKCPMSCMFGYLEVLGSLGFAVTSLPLTLFKKSLKLYMSEFGG